MIFFDGSNQNSPENSENAVKKSAELGKASRFKIQILKIQKFHRNFWKCNILLRKLSLQLFENFVYTDF